MLQLILSVCLVSHPASCKTHTATMFGANTPYSCSYNGQLYAAQWSARNPKYRVVGWKCGPVPSTAGI